MVGGIVGRSKVEEIKEQSGQLRGTIASTLAGGATHFEEEDLQLLKFHGSYQQDDRDLRAERKRLGEDKAWIMMVRCKAPGGDMTAEQWLLHDRIADELGNGTLRLTSRQGIQFHGVLKGHLREVIAQINRSGLTTWGACGDVVRNTVACATPLKTPAHIACQLLAREISRELLPKSTAYPEIWLDGERLPLQAGAEVEEPIYGKVYLPRKFKIGLAVPPQNDCDIYTQDLGLVCHANEEAVEGFTVLVGGGFGMSHGQTHTYPVLAKPLFFVRPEHVMEAVIGIISVQRDHGNREDRRVARLKYVIEKHGIDWFRGQVLSRIKVPTEPAREVRFETVGDALGWHEQGDGRWFCGVHVEHGRVKDGEKAKYRTAFRAIAHSIGCPVRVTPNSRILFYDIDPARRAEFEGILAANGIHDAAAMTEARKTCHACVSLPTCGLGLAESERVFGRVMDKIDAVLRELGLEKEPILIRMTGCPNGCSRPYNADLSFVGRAPGKYAFYAGGSHRGDRLVGLERKVVTEEEIPSIVREYLEDFVRGRHEGESFTDFWARTRATGDAPHPEQFHVEFAERAARSEKIGCGVE